MGRVKSQPRRNLRVMVRKWPMRPFPRKPAAVHLTRQELGQHVRQLASQVVWDHGAIAALHAASLAHLHEHVGLAQLSAVCGRRTVLTHRDWLLAARIRGMRTQ